MLKNFSNALVQLHEPQKMEQFWISFSFFGEICSLKIVEETNHHAEQCTQTKQHVKKYMHSSHLMFRLASSPCQKQECTA